MVDIIPQIKALQTFAPEPSSLPEGERERLEKELREKSLEELMALQRRKAQEAEDAGKALRAVRNGDLSPLASHMRSDESPDSSEINGKDAARAHRVIAEKHLRDKQFVSEVYKGEDPAAAQESQRQRLKKFFPSTPTETLLVRDDHGNVMVATLGISVEEMDAAYRLEAQQQKAREESERVTGAIQNRVKELGNAESKTEGAQTIPANAVPRRREPESTTDRTR